MYTCIYYLSISLSLSFSLSLPHFFYYTIVLRTQTNTLHQRADSRRRSVEGGDLVSLKHICIYPSIYLYVCMYVYTLSLSLSLSLSHSLHERADGCRRGVEGDNLVALIHLYISTYIHLSIYLASYMYTYISICIYVYIYRTS